MVVEGVDARVYNEQSGPKRAPVYYCNNFIYCQPTFIIFGIIHCRKLAMRDV